jgi:enoyl-CoA hydratase/carnithine racemase
MSSENAPVIFEEITTQNGFKIGHARLAKPAALNALDLQMINLLTPQLLKWQSDPLVAMVLLDGEGDRAFCAGGDIVTMYKSMLEATNAADESADEMALQEFFTKEYALDYLIHTYSKPILAWGNGIVMGGGLGLMSGASHRIVTETSRLAMPEISIGLYPDVGGSYFLNKMPTGCGLFLGLTGASINATDALYVNLADHYIPTTAYQALLDKLIAANWQTDKLALTLTMICTEFEQKHGADLPQGNLEALQPWLDDLAAKTELTDSVEFIQAPDSENNKWLSKAQKTLKAGSPLSAQLVHEQLKRGQSLSLAECFQMELGVSCQCGEFGEFQEGVRALLIDKDYQPNWRFKTVADVPSSTIDFFFKELWANKTHPLAQLSQSK